MFDDTLPSGGDLEIGMRFQQAGHLLVWDERVVVWHPARASYGQLKQKIERVREGRARLRSQVAMPARLCADYPTPAERDQKPSAFELFRFLMIRRQLDALRRR